jgi:hypothetical protein
MSTPKTQAARTKAALQLAKKLEAAHDAMYKFIRACNDDGDRYPYADDQRVTMARAMMEYSGYLDSVHNRPGVSEHLKFRQPSTE